MAERHNQKKRRAPSKGSLRPQSHASQSGVPRSNEGGSSDQPEALPPDDDYEYIFVMSFRHYRTGKIIRSTGAPFRLKVRRKVG